jgi:sugar phosphate isomerase/epimerase
MLHARRPGRLKIGATDWNLELTGKVEAVAEARKLGFDGVQISIGRKVVSGKMPLDNADLIQRYRTASAAHKVPIDSSCLDRLHDDCLKNGDAVSRVADGIRITKSLGVRIMLLPFFGKCVLAASDLDRIADILREIAPDAEKTNVILGLENTLSAEENARILDRAKSPSVLVYYDVGNSTQFGHDVLREIPWLGKDRICQFHLKDNPHYLGEGSIDFAKVLAAIRGIGFDGFANLETDAPSKAVEPDMRRNLAFVRDLLNR